MHHKRKATGFSIKFLGCHFLDRHRLYTHGNLGHISAIQGICNINRVESLRARIAAALRKRGFYPIILGIPVLVIHQPERNGVKLHPGPISPDGGSADRLSVFARQGRIRFDRDEETFAQHGYSLVPLQMLRGKFSPERPRQRLRDAVSVTLFGQFFKTRQRHLLAGLHPSLDLLQGFGLPGQGFALVGGE